MSLITPRITRANVRSSVEINSPIDETTFLFVYGIRDDEIVFRWTVLNADEYNDVYYCFDDGNWQKTSIKTFTERASEFSAGTHTLSVKVTDNRFGEVLAKFRV